MSRTREFDADQALEAALGVFWRKGYEATSVQDLVDATGVNRASLYQTFGSKAGLFRKAIERYAAERSVERATAGVRPGLARIRAALRHAAEETVADVRGCLVANAIMELGGEHREMRALGEKSREGLERFFEESLAEARRRGEISGRRDRKALARFLTNALFGLRVTAKTRAGPEAVRSVVETTLRFIEKS